MVSRFKGFGNGPLLNVRHADGRFRRRRNDGSHIEHRVASLPPVTEHAPAFLAGQTESLTLERLGMPGRLKSCPRSVRLADCP